MILESAQEFTLVHPQGQAQALAFVRSPDVALSQVRFLAGLNLTGQELSGTLLVKAPGLGEVDLPFLCQVTETADGAVLQAVDLPTERAWVAVNGQAKVVEATMTFTFHFTAHLALPDVPGWGGAAFEKMVNAAAQRTLSRVASALPRDMQATLGVTLD